MRPILFVPACIALAIATVPSLGANVKPDAPFKLRCTSTSTKSLPKGMAGAGTIEFIVRVDPVAQTVMLDGGKRAAKVDQYEIAFAGENDSSVSISRSMKRFGVVVPIKDLPTGDSRKYLYYEGKCEGA